MEKLISIIIPVYNLANCIQQTLDSVFSQIYDNIEVIAVDDGSEDDSLNILMNYQKKETRLKVYSKQNGGVTSARLFGVKKSKGEYIGFVDGDDLIDTDMYYRLVENMEKNNADISHCGYSYVRDSGISYFYNSGLKLEQNNEEGIRDLVEGEQIEPGLCNKLFKKSLFNDLLNGSSVMNFELRNNEDLLMNYCLFKNAEKSYYEDFCPYRYIIRDESAAHGRLNEHKLKDPIIASKIILDDLSDNNLYLFASRLYVVKMLQVSTNVSREIKDFKDIRKKVRSELKKFIGKYIKIEPSVSKILKIIFAAYLPDIYGVVHNIYSKLK